jgi:hypothetical protein
MKKEKTMLTEFGFKQINLMPSKNEPKEYYSTQYYQKPRGAFQQIT